MNLKLITLLVCPSGGYIANGELISPLPSAWKVMRSGTMDQRLELRLYHVREDTAWATFTEYSEVRLHTSAVGRGTKGMIQVSIKINECKVALVII